MPMQVIDSGYHFDNGLVLFATTVWLVAPGRIKYCDLIKKIHWVRIQLNATVWSILQLLLKNTLTKNKAWRELAIDNN